MFSRPNRQPVKRKSLSISSFVGHLAKDLWTKFGRTSQIAHYLPILSVQDVLQGSRMRHRIAASPQICKACAAIAQRVPRMQQTHAVLDQM